jgi:flagellar basal-body rod modification protein FlgD
MTVNPLTATGSNSLIGSTGQTGSPGPAGSNDPLLSMSSGNTFLQLLVAQLKYQDPMNPADPTQFMSQTAQMSEAANISAMLQSEQSVQSEINTLSSTSMIGKQVSAKLADGTLVSGVVSSVGIESTGPVLHVGGASVPLSSVTGVSDPSSTTTPTGTSTTSTGTTSTGTTSTSSSTA